MKKAGETKKSFLSNTGKALIQASVEGIHTPLAKKVEPASKLFTLQVYSDNTGSDCEDEPLEFTKPAYNHGEKYFRVLMVFIILDWNIQIPSKLWYIRENH